MATSFDSSRLFSAINKRLVGVSIILALLLIGCIVIERVVHDSKRNKVIACQTLIIAAYKNAPTKIDTCIVKPVSKQPVFRIGPYVGLSLNSFSMFPGIEAGAQLIIKDQLTELCGGLYLYGIYGNLRVGWLLK